MNQIERGQFMGVKAKPTVGRIADLTHERASERINSQAQSTFADEWNRRIAAHGSATPDVALEPRDQNPQVVSETIPIYDDQPKKRGPGRPRKEH